MTTKETTKKTLQKNKKIKKSELSPKAIKYFSAVGRRKTAVARVRIFTSKNNEEKQESFLVEKEKSFLVNERPLKEYFPIFGLQETALSSFKETDCLNLFNTSVKAKGGGIFAQADAIRHGIAKALILFNPDFRKKLKKAGFLTRDPRMRERKKFGLKRARRAPQWSKR